jgi:hypothetical protein
MHIQDLNPQVKGNYYDTLKPLNDSEKTQLMDSFRNDLKKPNRP